MAAVVPAVNPGQETEQGQELQHPIERALAQVPEDSDSENGGPLAGLGGQLRSVLGAALPHAGGSSGASPHPDQFGPGLEAPAGEAEMGAASSASGVGDLLPLAAAAA
jgi:hypothetical protein